MFELLKSEPDVNNFDWKYDVKFDKEYTVKEFIEEMMQTRVGDWGCINIYDNAKRIEQLEYDTAGNHCISYNQDHKIKKAYAVCRGSRADYNIWIKYQKQKSNKVTKGSLRFIVKKPNGEESVVVIFKNKADGTYSFVNLTKEHICSCKFETIEEAIQDMNDRLRKGLIESYVVKGEMKQ